MTYPETPDSDPRTMNETMHRCIARAKKDGVDFVSRCAPNTRVLMSCMDEHPEYYTIKVTHP